MKLKQWLIEWRLRMALPQKEPKEARSRLADGGKAKKGKSAKSKAGKAAQLAAKRKLLK